MKLSRMEKRVVLLAGLAICAAGAHAQTVLYTSTGGSGSQLYKIDVTAQSISFIGSIGADRVSGLDFRSDGTLFGVAGGSTGPASLWTIDINTGAGSRIGGLTNIQGADGLAFDQKDNLYSGGWNGTVGHLLTIDASTGSTLSDVQMSGSGNSFVSGLDFNSKGTLYGSRGNASSRTDDVVTIDLVTGKHTMVSGLTDVVSGVWFDNNDVMYGINTAGDVMIIDAFTGDKKKLFNTGVNNMSGLAGVDTVPEPISMVALGAGLLAMARRRRKTA